MVKCTTILIFTLFSYFHIVAQDCFARIELNKRSVYVQQPFRVTVRVLTKTWYTAPLDFDNIQIPNAFIIPFDRTQSGMYPVGDKQYAGLEFYYIVFPYKAGIFTIPPIHIVATTPPEGSSESRKVTLVTAPQKIIVRDVPAALKTGSWFVAKDVALSERWNKPLRNLKVGDVLERTITIDAKGTLPQFIPELDKIKPDWASIYPDDGNLEDIRDENDANGKRTETITYLVEKAGDFKVPQIKITWWNPNNSHQYAKSTAPLSIHINQNLNLGILTTLKDSLQATQKITSAPKEKKRLFSTYGIPWYWFTLYTLLGIVVLFIIIRSTIRIVKWLLKKRSVYLQSEPYWFKKFMHTKDSPEKTITGMYKWWDRSDVNSGNFSAIDVLEKDNETEAVNNLNVLYKSMYKDNEKNENPPEIKQFKTLVKKYRHRKKGKNHLQDLSKIPTTQQTWNL